MDVVIPCICPERPHETDTVRLRDTLDFRQAVTIRNSAVVARASEEASTPEAILAVLSEAYMVIGITEWTLVDAAGKAVKVTPDTIRGVLMPHVLEAVTVADAADGLYASAVVIPLLMAASVSSQPTPTAGSTSRTNGSPSKSQKPSKRSSTTTIPTDATEPTSGSLVGVSS